MAFCLLGFFVVKLELIIKMLFLVVALNSGKNIVNLPFKFQGEAENQFRVGKKSRSMKINFTRLFVGCVLLLSAGQISAQLTGTINIPNITYPTLASVIADLNLQGVGTGGVTINLLTGNPETAPTGGYLLGSAILNASTSVTKTITINGNGNTITAFAGGTGTTDGIFKIQGVDYLTIDGLNLSENSTNTTATTQMEWGYALVKRQNTLPYDGCQFVTIRNCTITMGIVSTTSTAIQVGNHIATATTALSGTSATASDANSNNSFYGNTISNTIRGIYMIGMTTAAVYDFNNSVGVPVGNAINFGATTITTGYGIYAQYDTILTVNNNNFTLGNTLTTGTTYCLYQASGGKGRITIEGNNFNLSRTGTSGSAYGFYNVGAADVNASLNFNNNTASSIFPTATSGAVYVFYNNGNTFDTVNINNNIISPINAGTTTGTIYGIYNPANVSNNVFSANNVFKNITRGAGTTYAFYHAATGTGTISVTNNLVDTITNATTLYSVYVNGSATQTLINKFNRVNGVMGTSSTFYGFNTTGGNLNSEMAFDTLTNVQVGGSSYCLYSGMSEGSGVHDNIVENVTASSTNAVYGGYSGVGSTSFYNNKISNFNRIGTSGVTYGIYYSTASNAAVYNNFITDISVPSTYSVAQAAYGIYCSAATAYKIYHNTIRLNMTSSGANFGATGIYYSSSAANSLDLKNNIIYVNASPAGTGYTAAVRRSSGTAGTPANNFTSNGNIYYTPNVANSYIYAEGTAVASLLNAYNLTNDPSFNTGCSAYKTFMGQDQASFYENNLSPGPINGTYIPTTSTYAKSVATITTNPAVTKDFAGITRAANSDAGALEFTATPVDAAGPEINYTILPKTTHCTTPPTLNATITDASGVNTIIGLAPRLYYKKSSETDTFSANNTNSFNGWKFVDAIGTAPNFSFTIDYSLLTSPVAPGDSLSYFVISQDLNNNVNKNKVAFTSPFCPSSVNLSTATPTSSQQLLNGYRVLALPSFVTNISLASICVIGATAMNVNPAPSGVSIQWQQNNGTTTFTDIPGATNTSYVTPALSNPAFQTVLGYRAELRCSSNLVATTSTGNVTVTNPSIIDPLHGSRCGPGYVTLAATAAPGATINWYTNPTGGSPIATGGAITPNVAATTNYYAAASDGGVIAYVGKTGIESSAATGGGLSTYMIFDAYTNFVLQSVDLFPYGATPGPGTVTIELRNSSGTTLMSQLVNVTSAATPATSVAQTVTLNFPVAPGTGYRLGVGAWTGGVTNLYRDNVNFSYPYTVPGMMSITGPSTAGYFYFFYNWKVATGCESARVPITATINAGASTTGLSTGGTTVINTHAASTQMDYVDACFDKVASITSGTSSLGSTSAVTVTLPGVKSFNNKPYVPRIFDIVPANNVSATITLYALQSEFNAYNSYVTTNSLGLPLLPTGPTDVLGMSNIVVTQFHGGALAGTSGPLGLYNSQNSTFITNGNITPMWTGQYWSITFPVNGFSGFFIHTGNTPLFIGLRDISAANIGKRNRIDWSTLTEQKGDVFELQRSGDGDNFTTITGVNAKGEGSTYSYWDESPVNGNNHYRLKLMDAQGKYSYSKVVTALLGKADGLVLEAYPNPVSEVLTLKVYGASGSNPAITISDVTGKMIKMVGLTDNYTQINMSGLADGVYLIKYTDSKYSEIIRVDKR